VQVGTHAVLIRSDFENAVRDALRNYARPDMLAGNPLLHAQLLTYAETGSATPQALI